MISPLHQARLSQHPAPPEYATEPAAAATGVAPSFSGGQSPFAASHSFLAQQLLRHHQQMNAINAHLANLQAQAPLPLRDLHPLHHTTPPIAYHHQQHLPMGAAGQQRAVDPVLTAEARHLQLQLEEQLAINHSLLHRQSQLLAMAATPAATTTAPTSSSSSMRASERSTSPVGSPPEYASSSPYTPSTPYDNSPRPDANFLQVPLVLQSTSGSSSPNAIIGGLQPLGIVSMTHMLCGTTSPQPPLHGNASAPGSGSNSSVKAATATLSSQDESREQSTSKKPRHSKSPKASPRTHRRPELPPEEDPMSEESSDDELISEDEDDSDQGEEDDEDDADHEEPPAHPRRTTKLMSPKGSARTADPTSSPEVVLNANGKPKRMKGVSCHQCKTRRTNLDLYHCGMAHAKKPSGARARRRKKERFCRKKYCARCLDKFYGELPPEKLLPGEVNTWACPGCRGLCTCAACKRGSSKRSEVVEAVAVAVHSKSVAKATVAIAQPELKRHHSAGSTSSSTKGKSKLKQSPLSMPSRKRKTSSSSMKTDTPPSQASSVSRRSPRQTPRALSSNTSTTTAVEMEDDESHPAAIYETEVIEHFPDDDATDGTTHASAMDMDYVKREAHDVFDTPDFHSRLLSRGSSDTVTRAQAFARCGSKDSSPLLTSSTLFSVGSQSRSLSPHSSFDLSQPLSPLTPRRSMRGVPTHIHSYAQRRHSIGFGAMELPELL